MTPTQDEINSSIAALYYLLYRQAGCPMGHTHQGFLTWVGLKQQEFEELGNPQEQS